MISRARHLTALLAIALAAAACTAPGAWAGAVGAVQHFPTHCAVGNLVAGPEGDVWFPCNRPASRGKLAQAAIGRVTPEGEVSELTAGIPSRSTIGDLLVGPDGNLWFTLAVQGGHRSLGKYRASIARMTPAGQVSIFSAGLEAGSAPGDLIAGTDGNVWFTDRASPPQIGRVTPDGSITEFPIALPQALAVGGLAAAADGSVWFTQVFDLPHGDHEPGGLIGKVTSTGAVTSFGSPPAAFGAPIAGPDGNVWFVESSGKTSIDRVTPTGEILRIGGRSIGLPTDLVTGPDGNVWFTAQQSIGRVTPSGEVTSFSKCLDYRQLFSEATSIVPGPSGDLWFTSVTSRETPSIEEPPTVGRITADGQITQFKAGIVGEPTSIVAGPDGRVWFSAGGEELERITPPTAPVNTFLLAGGEASRGGAAEVAVEVPGPGTIRLQPIAARLPGGVIRSVGGSVTQVVAPSCGQSRVRFRLRGAALAAVRAGRLLKLKVRTTFTPTGGAPNTETRTVFIRPRSGR